MRHRRTSAFRYLSFAAAVIMGLLILTEGLPYLEAELDKQRLIDTFVSDSEDDTSKEDTSPLGMKVDFEALKEINEDIAGWIYIPGTQVNYAILQHPSEDTYYLYHSAEKQENVLGSVFMYSDAAADFSDSHTILFGHNMSSGQMFGELSNYTDENFYREYPYVYIYIPDKSMQCTIYSAYSCPVSDVTYSVGYGCDTEEFYDFVQHTVQLSCWQSDVLSDCPDRVITLSTCTDDRNASRRFVVNCIVTEVRTNDDADESFR